MNSEDYIIFKLPQTEPESRQREAAQFMNTVPVQQPNVPSVQVSTAMFIDDFAVFSNTDIHGAINRAASHIHFNVNRNKARKCIVEKIIPLGLKKE